MHGAGFTGSGERYLQSVVAVEATAEGNARVLASSCEMGQGIQHGALPDRGGCARHRHGGRRDRSAGYGTRAQQRADRGVKDLHDCRKAGGVGGAGRSDNPSHRPASLEGRTFAQACREYLQRNGSLKVWSKYDAPPGLWWNDDTYTGDAYGTFAWAVYVAEVAVDMDDVRDARQRLRRGTGSGTCDQSRLGPGPDRRRCGAGDRAGVVRETSSRARDAWSTRR